MPALISRASYASMYGPTTGDRLRLGDTDLIVEVVKSPVDVHQEAYTGDGPHVNSDFLDGLDVAAAKTKVIAWLAEPQALPP